jgi:drug/metabolite transporter (DMT)-like permease
LARSFAAKSTAEFCLRSIHMPQRSQLRLISILFIGFLAVSTSSILIRLARAEGVPALVIAAYRLTLATLILTPIVLRRQCAELKRLARRDVLIAIASGLFLTLHFATWVSSFDYTSVTSSVVLVTTGPIWVALTSWIILRERLSQPMIVGVIITVVGGVVVGLADACDLKTGSCSGLSIGGTQLWGDALALMGAWMVTGYLLIGRYLRNRMPLLIYIFVVYGTAAIGLILIVALSGQSFVFDQFGEIFSLQAVVWLILLAIAPQLLGHSAYNYALRFLSPAFVAIITVAEPIGASILAFVILHELPGPLTLIGAFIILIGIAVASRPARANSPAT